MGAVLRTRYSGCNKRSQGRPLERPSQATTCYARAGRRFQGIAGQKMSGDSRGRGRSIGEEWHRGRNVQSLEIKLGGVYSVRPAGRSQDSERRVLLRIIAWQERVSIRRGRGRAGIWGRARVAVGSSERSETHLPDSIGLVAPLETVFSNNLKGAGTLAMYRTRGCFAGWQR